MKRILLIGALIAPFFSTGVYAATCTDTAPGDGYDDTCAAQMRLEIPVFAVIQFPAAGGAAGSDLSVAWDGMLISVRKRTECRPGSAGRGGEETTCSRNKKPESKVKSKSETEMISQRRTAS